MRSRLSQLGCLIAVAEEGQIARAAQRLDVTQSAVSRALAQLETEVGVELLTRQPRGVALTPAGTAFLAKARTAHAAETEAGQTAAALQRAAHETLLVGFVGPPPSFTFAKLFDRVGHDPAKIAFQDLPYPSGTTAGWLGGVDVALCHMPRSEAGISTLPVRVEPRAVVMGGGHRLAARSQIAVADVLDETFIGLHPNVQPEWAAFHYLDDERGGPPLGLTGDEVATTLQMLATFASSGAVTIVPIGDIIAARAVLADVNALPLEDAAPAVVSLVWREDSQNALLGDLIEAARELDAGGDGV
jgi:DNA-binding transcriptional LysR family regulator